MHLQISHRQNVMLVVKGKKHNVYDLIEYFYKIASLYFPIDLLNLKPDILKKILFKLLRIKLG